MTSELNILEVKLLSENAKPPFRATSGSAGYDLYSPHEQPITILPRTRRLIDLEISIAIPIGYYGRIAPRSSLSLKGIDVAGGVIDSDYRGHLGVILINNSDQEFIVKQGDRIAQLIIEKICTPEVIVVEELTETTRGEGGWGSTGK